MILSAHQPAYLPWPGYLARIAQADMFVILDTVQFEKNSFTNRNQIKTQHGAQWLTVPVHLAGHMEKPIHEIQVDQTQGWRRKHVETIRHAYARAPLAGSHLSRFLEHIRGLDQSYLSNLCRANTDFFLAEYGIKTRIFPAPIKKRKSGGTELILDLCRDFGADTFLAGPLGRDYLDLKLCEQAKVQVLFQDWQSPVYPQLHGNFIPNLSILDLWLNATLNPFSSLLHTPTMKLWVREEPSPSTLPTGTLSILS